MITNLYLCTYTTVVCRDFTFLENREYLGRNGCQVEDMYIVGVFLFFSNVGCTLDQNFEICSAKNRQTYLVEKIK